MYYVLVAVKTQDVYIFSQLYSSCLYVFNDCTSTNTGLSHTFPMATFLGKIKQGFASAESMSSWYFQQFLYKRTCQDMHMPVKAKD